MKVLSMVIVNEELVVQVPCATYHFSKENIGRFIDSLDKEQEDKRNQTIPQESL